MAVIALGEEQQEMQSILYLTGHEMGIASQQMIASRQAN